MRPGPHLSLFAGAPIPHQRHVRANRVPRLPVHPAQPDPAFMIVMAKPPVFRRFPHHDHETGRDDGTTVREPDSKIVSVSASDSVRSTTHDHGRYIRPADRLMIGSGFVNVLRTKPLPIMK